MKYTVKLDKAISSTEQTGQVVSESIFVDTLQTSG